MPENLSCVHMELLCIRMDILYLDCSIFYPMMSHFFIDNPLISLMTWQGSETVHLGKKNKSPLDQHWMSRFKICIYT
jgi:hypothetical protein